MKAKKKYEKGGILPEAIKKLKEKAAKKKAEKSKPSYRGKLDEVTVTAKAPTEAEMAGAKAFVEFDGLHKVDAYATAAAGREGSKGYDENIKSARKLSKDTKKRLSISNDPVRVGQELKQLKRKKDWIKALKKAGYKK